MWILILRISCLQIGARQSPANAQTRQNHVELAWMPAVQAMLAKRSSEDERLTTPCLQEPPYDLERRDGL